jgi:hypothetical protein
MAVRLDKLLPFRGRPRASAVRAAIAGRRGGEDCPACGSEVAADGHAIQLSGGVFHARCVLYRPRPVPMPPRRLRTTR